MKPVIVSQRKANFFVFIRQERLLKFDKFFFKNFDSVLSEKFKKNQEKMNSKVSIRNFHCKQAYYKIHTHDQSHFHKIYH